MQREQPTCTLCFEDFVDPRRLPCGDTHVFCSRCLYHHIRGDNEDGQFRCPLCDSQHSVPETGMSGVREQFPPATGLTTPQAVSEETSGTKVFCNVKGHGKKEMVVFCTTHSHMVCSKCLTEKHKNCVFSQFEEEVPRQKEHIQELLVKIQQYSDDLKKLTQDTKAAYSKSDQDIEHIKQKIEHTLRQLEAILNKKKSTLLTKVDKIKNQRAQKEVMTSQKESIQKADNIISSCHSLQKESELGKILEEATAVKEAWENLHTNTVKTFCWEFSSEEINKECDDWLGVLTSQVEVQENRPAMPVKTGFLHESTGGQQGQLASSSHMDHIQTKVADRYVSGIFEVGDMVLCTHDYTAAVYVYSKHDGKAVSEVTIPGLGNPLGGLLCLNTASHGDMELVISDFCNSCLHMVTLNREWSPMKHQKKQLEYQPYGIALYQSGACTELIVADPVTAKKVYIYDVEGAQKAAVQLQDGQFTYPNCAYKTTEGFVVGDFNEKKVIWTNKRGAVLRSYSGVDQHKLACLFKLTVDPQSGHVLIADCYGHAIHEVTMQGQCTRILVTEKDGIRYPFAIHLGTSGRLYVGTSPASGSKEIKVFQYHTRQQTQCTTVNTTVTVNLKIPRWN